MDLKGDVSRNSEDSLRALPTAEVPLHQLVISTNTPTFLCRAIGSELEVLDTFVMCTGQSSDDLVFRGRVHADIGRARSESDHNISLLKSITRAIDIRVTLSLLLRLLIAIALLPGVKAPIQRRNRLLRP